MPPLGRLICHLSPALLLGDLPFATCSWDPGSKINKQIETDSKHDSTFNKLSQFVCCVCTQRCDRALYVFFVFAYWYFLFSYAVWFFATDWLTFAARCTMSNNMAKIADARKTVEQLKLEVNIERMMVSWSMIENLLKVRKHFTLLDIAACLVMSYEWENSHYVCM